MNASYSLKIHPKLETQLQRIPKSHRERVINTMRSLRYDPRPSGCVKLDNKLYRIRQGEYRIIYAIFDNELILVFCKVARRSEDTYKNLQTLLDRAENILGNK